MVLPKRQSVNYEIFDDQSPALEGQYVGNWTHVPYQGFQNNTLTATPTPGASFAFTFQGKKVVGHWSLVMLGADVPMETGSQAYLYGVLFIDKNGTIVSYPTANYTIDDAPGESFNGNPIQSSAHLVLHCRWYPKSVV